MYSALLVTRLPLLEHSRADIVKCALYRGRDPEQARANAAAVMVLERHREGDVWLDAPECAMDVLVQARCRARLWRIASHHGQRHICGCARLIAQPHHKCPAHGQSIPFSSAAILLLGLLCRAHFSFQSKASAHGEHDMTAARVRRLQMLIGNIYVPVAKGLM